MAKRPSFQFYPGDWLRSTDLRSCSVGARGLWIDMICLMHEGAEYGYLKVGAKVILPDNLARMVGATLPEVEGWLDELVTSGVVSTDEHGCYLCRRMIRDEEIRVKRAAGGDKGGNPALTGTRKVNDKDIGKVGQKVNLPANLQPTPASPSASPSAFELPHTPAVEDSKARNAFLTGPSDAFHAFWKAYPRKISPTKAWEVWQAVVTTLMGTRGEPDNVIEAWLCDRAEAYACAPAGQPPAPGQNDYRPSPATWLVEGKYDEPSNEWKTPNAPNGRSGANRKSRGQSSGAAQRSGGEPENNVDALFDQLTTTATGEAGLEATAADRVREAG